MKKLLNDIKKRNYGDAVERVTKATGIKKIVQAVSKATGTECGCNTRKKKWNLGNTKDETTKTGL